MKPVQLVDRLQVKTEDELFSALERLRFARPIRMAILAPEASGFGDIYSIKKFIEKCQSLAPFEIIVYAQEGNEDNYKKVYQPLFGDIVRTIKKKDTFQHHDKNAISLQRHELQTPDVCPDIFVALPMSNTLKSGDPSMYFPIDCPDSVKKVAFEYGFRTFKKSPHILDGVFIAEYLHGNTMTKSQAAEQLINVSLKTAIIKAMKVPKKIYFGYSAQNYAQYLFMLLTLNFQYSDNFEYHFVGGNSSDFLDEFKSILDSFFLIETESLRKCAMNFSDDIHTTANVIMNFRYVNHRNNSIFKYIVNGLSMYKEMRYYQDGQLIKSYPLEYTNKKRNSLNIYRYSKLENMDMMHMQIISEPLVLVTGDQSLFEALSYGHKVPLYETQGWKIELANEIIRLVDSDKNIQEIVRLFMMNNVYKGPPKYMAEALAMELTKFNNITEENYESYEPLEVWQKADLQLPDISDLILSIEDLKHIFYRFSTTVLPKYNINIQDLIEEIVPRSLKIDKKLLILGARGQSVISSMTR